MALNFSNILTDVNRKARLEGRPVAQREMEGLAEGAASESTNRLSIQAELELKRKALEDAKKEREANRIQDLEDRKDVRNSERKAGIGSIAGAMIGYAYGGPAGGAVGSTIGGTIGGGCIIISACTDRKSYEVEISREFRDKYMSTVHLGGYYALAHRVAPLIEKSHLVKLIFKKFLVDRLVDYGEWILEIKPKRQLKTSRIITTGFLSLCAAIGMCINITPYIEAHR